MVFLDWKNPSLGTLYMPITEGLLDTLKHAKAGDSAALANVLIIPPSLNAMLEWLHSLLMVLCESCLS